MRFLPAMENRSIMSLRNQIESIFNLRPVAIIGASHNAGSRQEAALLNHRACSDSVPKSVHPGRQTHAAI